MVGTLRTTLRSALLAVLSSVTSPAGAEPQWHLALRPALGIDGPPDERRYAFWASAHGDLMFGRTRSSQFAIGPAAELGSQALSDLRPALLAQVLVPLGTLDATLAAGPQWRLPGDHPLALAGRVFLGYRAYNFSAPYGLGAGVFVGLDQPLVEAPATWTAGLHLDLMLLSLPFIAGASWLR